MSQPTPFKNGAESFGNFYPKHYVLAVYPDDATAGRARDALRAAGFGEDDVIAVSGPEVVARAHDAVAHQGVFTRLKEQWSRLYTDASTATQALIDAAGRGAAFVLAYAPEDDQVERAANALRPLGPQVLRNYGTFTVTDLS